MCNGIVTPGLSLTMTGTMSVSHACHHDHRKVGGLGDGTTGPPHNHLQSQSTPKDLKYSR